MVTTILRYQADAIAYFFYSGQAIWSYSMPIDSLGVPQQLADYQGLFKARQLHACTSATTLAINVVLGDAIVCWRACVVWQQNRVVKTLCGLFLFVFVPAMGGGGASRSCVSAAIENAQSSLNDQGVLFGRESIEGSLAYAFSLATNLLATLLVAYKAWRSRRRLGRYLVAKVGGSQVEKLMALLVESGLIYCVLLAVVLAYQICQSQDISRNYYNPAASSHEEYRFMSVFSIVVDGALVPAIAIYPTIIIVLVALNRSHIERGLTQHLESLPTLNLALTVDTLATSLCASRVDRRLEVPVKEDAEVRPLTGRDIFEGDAPSRRTSEEQCGEAPRQDATA
uniref:Ketoreductase CTB6 ) n=1 Tax=Ganoderma boninense TaxID=34458 RepID=A0A5K1JVF6_9APHY|nr:Ketoreductase CTB6 (EC (Cercosporin toxin biosynthesis cluster protein 6) [Ganoderma boninense]